MANVLKEKGLTIVEVDPEYDSLDEWKIRQFLDLLLDAVGKDDGPLVLIDLTKTTFIGSSFVGVLIRAWKRVRQRHGRMALCGVNDVCGDVLKVTKLDSIWEIYDTRDEARRALVGSF